MYNLVKEHYLPNPKISDGELRGIAEEVIQMSEDVSERTYASQMQSLDEYLSAKQKMRFVNYLFQHEAA